MSKNCSPMKNRGGGADDEKAQSKKKAATSGKGRHRQGRGSAEHNTKPQYAKKMAKGKTDYMEKMVF